MLPARPVQTQLEKVLRTQPTGAPGAAILAAGSMPVTGSPKLLVNPLQPFSAWRGHALS